MRTLNGEVLAGAPINPGLGTARERGACNQAKRQDRPQRFRILIKEISKLPERLAPPTRKRHGKSPEASLGVLGYALTPLRLAKGLSLGVA